MTLASLLGILVTRRMGLRTRLTAAAETKAIGLGDVRSVVIGVVKVSLIFEAATALILTLRFWLGYDEPIGRATYLGVFHAVSAFNNAGFALYSDSLMQFVEDPWICLPIAVAVILGGIGFPVLFELRKELRRPGRWSLHTKMTVSTTAALLLFGTAFVTAIGMEQRRHPWAVERPRPVPRRVLPCGDAANRGLQRLDYGQMNEAPCSARTS